jgi:hypothetical protein
MRLPIAVLACIFLTTAQGQSLLPSKAEPISLLKPSPIQLTYSHLPSPWVYQHLGMFCKLDVQLERRAKFPVLFRLGDVQQVDAWEGKGPLRLR